MDTPQNTGSGQSSTLYPIRDDQGQIKQWNDLTSEQQTVFGTQTNYDKIVKQAEGGSQGGSVGSSQHG